MFWRNTSPARTRLLLWMAGYSAQIGTLVGSTIYWGAHYSKRSLCDLSKVVHVFSEEEFPGRCTELINVCNGRTDVHPAELVSTAAFLLCTPDDLAFLWSPNGRIEFSDTMWAWLASLRCRLDALTAAGTDLIPPSDFLRFMVTALADINPSDSLIGNFAWREMFFDWIQAASNLRVQASVVLMKELTSQPSDATQCVSNLRRYLAILGNPALREYVLGIYIDR